MVKRHPSLLRSAGMRVEHGDQWLTRWTALERGLLLFWINAGLLIFNMLPIYPLDGGQILRSLLWFVIGRAKSLTVASVIAGARTPDQVRANSRAASWKLTPADLAEIDRILA